MVIKAEYDRLKTVVRTPSALLSQLNMQLASNRHRKVGATACCIDLRITAEGADVTYSNAAHPEVFRLGQQIDTLYVPGMYLGLSAAIEYVDTKCRLEPGHAILVYSDGASELQNADNAMFGSDCLAETALAAIAQAGDVQTALDTINATLTTYRGKRPADDDITLILFRVAQRQAGR